MTLVRLPPEVALLQTKIQQAMQDPARCDKNMIINETTKLLAALLTLPDEEHRFANMLNGGKSPPTGLRLDVAGALLTKRVPRFALPSTTIYDDSDIEVYQRPAILERVWLL